MITVALHYPHLACVRIEPSLIRKLLFRAPTQERWAVLVELITGGREWRFEDGSEIPAPVLSAIHAEVRHQRRPKAFAIEPPSTS